MNDGRNEVRVGLFTLGAMILLVWGWSWLKSFSLFHQPQKFTAQFTDIAGLSRNATVNVQGVRVGTVDGLEFVNDPQNPQQNDKINVHIKVTDPTVVIPHGARISIQTLGLVGAKYIEIALPHDAAGNVVPGKPLAPDEIVMPPDVQDPVRVELVMNKVATRIEDIVSNIDTQQASKAINNFSQATAKLNKNMDRFKDAAESVQTASNSIAATANKFGRTADNAGVAGERASAFFTTGRETMHNISEMSVEFRGTSSKLNKLLDNPNFSGDLKETITQARQTAETIRGAIGDLGTTLKDKDLREQVLTSLTHLEKSTDNLRSSMEMVNKISTDQVLRADLKDVLKTAHDTVADISNIVNQPDFKANVFATLNKLRTASTSVDQAARQIQEVLDKRAPLLHLLFGHPGKKVPASADDPTPHFQLFKTKPSAPVPPVPGVPTP